MCTYFNITSRIEKIEINCSTKGEYFNLFEETEMYKSENVSVLLQHGKWSWIQWSLNNPMNTNDKQYSAKHICSKWVRWDYVNPVVFIWPALFERQRQNKPTLLPTLIKELTVTSYVMEAKLKVNKTKTKSNYLHFITGNTQIKPNTSCNISWQTHNAWLWHWGKWQTHMLQLIDSINMAFLFNNSIL